MCKKTAHLRLNAPGCHASAGRGSLTEQTKIGTTSHQIRRNTLYRAFRPYFLSPAGSGSLTNELPSIFSAQERVPRGITLPIYGPHKIGEDLVGAASVEEEKLGQFRRRIVMLPSTSVSQRAFHPALNTLARSLPRRCSSSGVPRCLEKCRRSMPNGIALLHLRLRATSLTAAGSPQSVPILPGAGWYTSPVPTSVYPSALRR